MPYDERLAERVRELLPPGDWVEKPMFGGLAFLREGRMRLAVGHTGGLMLRLDQGEVEDALDPPDVDVVTMGRRRMRRWVGVAAGRVSDDVSLQAWLDRALESAT